MNYETVIGLEVHAELSTKTKIFCSCANEFGDMENTHCCPICTGMPGVLPSLNKKVVEYAVKAGLAMNCEISNYSKMDRKNYYYPDLPKAYQISQYDLPLCKNGHIDIEVNGEVRRIGITRIHIEEDAGKLFHDTWSDSSFIDYNRCGVPLIEIVSEPDLRSPEETRVFLESLKSILQYIEVSDCKMQEGSLRCDVNVSVRPENQKELGTRTEMKNVSSFRGTVRAIEFESKRQIELVENGEKIVQDTRRWDDGKGINYPMRSKEEAQDYRYFPEPDLVPIVLSDDYVKEIKSELPELPGDRMKRFVDQYELPPYDASIITGSRKLADFFEECAKIYDNPKTISNWIMGDMQKILKDKNIEVSDLPITAENMVKLLKLIDNKTITGTIAKKVFELMFDSNKSPDVIVKEKGLVQINNEDELSEIIKKIISENQKSVEDYKKGKERAMSYLVGQTMKATRGKANPQLLNKLMKEQLQNA